MPLSFCVTPKSVNVIEVTHETVFLAFMYLYWTVWLSAIKTLHIMGLPLLKRQAHICGIYFFLLPKNWGRMGVPMDWHNEIGSRAHANTPFCLLIFPLSVSSVQKGNITF